MLKGQAKADYMRDYMRGYMRRKRAGLPTTIPKPSKPDAPPQRVIDQIAYWCTLRAKQSSRLTALGARVIDGLALDSDASWIEACRRYEAITGERRAERERRKLEAAKPKQRHCSFCGEPASADRLLAGDGFPFICETCVAEAAAAITRHRCHAPATS